MRLERINIKKYLQFQNFNLDFTYPKGHPKAGQPMDKVCFIGQSGTGKTSLLNLIKAIIGEGLIERSYLTPEMHEVVGFVYDFSTNFKQDSIINKGVFNRQDVIIDGYYITNKDEIADYFKNHYQDSNVLVSFPAEMSTNLLSIFAPKTEGGFSFLEAKNTPPSVSSEKKLKFFDFERDNIEAVWNLILDDIQKYKIAQLSFNNDLTNKLNQGAIEPETLIKAFQDWKKNNPNPLKDLAEKLNPMLNRFNLEIKPEFDFKTAEDLRFIQVHQKNSGTFIPNTGWSTGTKQLIMTATPLLKLNTDKTVILIDEPERSFYPDIQRDLMGFYQHLAPNAQFFVATHSPIIAAAFDPWEIIELKFDENGNIVQEKNYDGERHINNYRFNPKYLRWDSILTQLFDLEADGMPERTEKLNKLALLDVKLQKLKKANGTADPKEVESVWAEFKETAALLDWKIQDFDAKN